MRLVATIPQVAVDAARLGAEIRTERTRQGLSQAELARRAKTHQAVVSKVELGEHELQWDLLVRLADALLGAKGLGVILLRAGAIDLDLPVRELLAGDPDLSERGRRLAVESYDFVREAQEKYEG